MESISLKLEPSILTEIDQSLQKHRYSTRTEFIRDAIREKLSDLERETMLKSLAFLKGSSSRKTSNEKLHEAREHAFIELEKKIR